MKKHHRDSQGKAIDILRTAKGRRWLRVCTFAEYAQVRPVARSKMGARGALLAGGGLHAMKRQAMDIYMHNSSHK